MKSLIPTNRFKEIVFILDEPHFYGCCFGQADGPDDYIKDCDCCQSEHEQEFLRQVKKYFC